jgi:hypothetical protein
MAGSGLSEGLRQGLRSLGEGLVEVDKRCKAYFGLLPNGGVVAADDAEVYSAKYRRGNGSVSYDPSDDLRQLIEDFPPGSILTNRTSLSKSGDEPVTLISGDSVTAERVREIMITLQIVDTVARNSDGASPLRALLDIAEAGGRVDIDKIGDHDKDVLSRYGLGKTFRLQWPEVASPMSFPIPFVKPSFIVDPDVVAVVKSGVVVDLNDELILRNPERPERLEYIEKIGDFLEGEATYREGKLPSTRALCYDLSSLSKIGNNSIDLRQWNANPLGEGEENSPLGFPRLSEQQVSSISERFGPLSGQLPSEQVRSIALRLEVLVQFESFLELYEHIVEREKLSRNTALLIESLGLGKAFYQGSSKPETKLGVQFEKGVVEVLLAGACWFHNSNDPFLGMTNPERQPNT